MNPNRNAAAEPIAIVLAAGMGTRMKSDLPKVLATACGRPLIAYVLETLREVGVHRTIVVVGYRADDVKDAVGHYRGVEFALQTERRGTGHAVMICRDQIDKFHGPVIIVTGDSPMLQADSLRQLLAEFTQSGAACVMGTLLHEQPAGLGRIIRDSAGKFQGIVEEKDATAEQRTIREVNMSTYVFDCRSLIECLDLLTNNNRQGEYYITDVPGIMRSRGMDVRARPVLKPCEAFSVNTVEDLEIVERELKRETARRMRELKVFGGRANPELSEKICQFLGLELGDCNLVTFPDGEFHCKIEDVRGRDVFLVQPTCPPVNDNLMELLIMIDTCKRASAERVTAVIPYFGYARQDRKDEGRVPITAKLVANMITRAGADRVLAMDLHAAQIQGFFDVPVDHLYAGRVLNSHFRTLNIPQEDLVIVSPDEGSIKRAVGHCKRLGGTLAIIDKRRQSATTTAQENLIGGPVDGKVCLMFDDMISTAGSICGAAKLIKKLGAREIHVAATHGLFAAQAIENLNSSPIDSIVVTDTIPLPPEKNLPQILRLPVASLLGEAIKRIHYHQSISEIFAE